MEDNKLITSNADELSGGGYEAERRREKKVDRLRRGRRCQTYTLRPTTMSKSQ